MSPQHWQEADASLFLHTLHTLSGTYKHTNSKSYTFVICTCQSYTFIFIYGWWMLLNNEYAIITLFWGQIVIFTAVQPPYRLSHFNSFLNTSTVAFVICYVMVAVISSHSGAILSYGSYVKRNEAAIVSYLQQQ